MDRTGYKDYQLTIDKIYEYGLYAAPDRKLIYAPPGLPKVEYTYTEFARRVNKLGEALEKLGVNRAHKPWEMGTRVAIMEWNTTRFQELLFAVPMYGAVAFTVNVRLSQKEIIYTMKQAEPEVLFVHTEFIPQLDGIFKEIKTIKKVVVMSDQITCTGEGKPPEVKVPEGVDLYEYEELLRNSGEGEYNWPELNEYVIATLFFTGGTTGLPKGVCHNHRQILLTCLSNSIAAMEYPKRRSSRDTVLQIVPLFHIFGWVWPYHCFMGGNELVFPGRYDWKHIARLIGEELIPEARKVGGRVLSGGVPTMLYSIVEEAKNIGVSLEGFVYDYGGMAIPMPLYEDCKKMGIKIAQIFGPSEMFASLTLWVWTPRIWMKMGVDDERLMDHFVSKNSLGVCMPLASVKITDEEGKEVSTGTTGKLLTRTPATVKEYLKDPKKSEEAWRFGMLDMDDYASVDEFGVVSFADRGKDAIKSGGE
jgi:fatty-acyl-CoA synthase